MTAQAQVVFLPDVDTTLRDIDRINATQSLARTLDGRGEERVRLSAGSPSVAVSIKARPLQGELMILTPGTYMAMARLPSLSASNGGQRRHAPDGTARCG